MKSRHAVPRDYHRAVSVVAIGASAGGVDALLALLPRLHAGWPGTVIVVMHMPEDRDSLLSSLFAQRCALPVVEAADKVAIEPGTVYFAPAGYHLLVERDRSFALSCDPPVRFSRPSIDVLFESAAEAYGPQLCAMLLTGANEDGARGLAEVAAAGGLTVVQEPREAQSPEMPRAGIAQVQPDFILSLSQLPALFEALRARS